MTRFIQGGEDGQVQGHQKRHEKEAQQNRQGEEKGKEGKKERKVTIRLFPPTASGQPFKSDTRCLSCFFDALEPGRYQARSARRRPVFPCGRNALLSAHKSFRKLADVFIPSRRVHEKISSQF
jgi:hypothetical protein